VGALGPASAFAARPVKGARYADTDFAFSADLRVSQDGRSLSSRRSAVSNSSDWQCPGLDFHVGSPMRPVRISQSGRFELVRRRGRFALLLSGRFQTKNRLKISFRYRREPARKSHPCDDSGRVTLTPRRVYPIPFHNCRTHKAKTVLSSATGRVFWQSLWDDRDGWTTVAYACLFSANRRFKLGQDEDDDSDLGPFRLVGPYVAYHGAYCSMGCGFDLRVLDLRDGTILRKLPESSSTPLGAVTDLELKDNGSIAWISRPAPYSTETAPSVSAYDSLGLRQLDVGDIELHSLELDGSTLSWTKEGVLQSATLN
jgi:hypothetical protein